MRTKICLLALLLFGGGKTVKGEIKAIQNEPDSAYIFSYATDKDHGGQGGLLFAWSTDKDRWQTIGNNYTFVRSDYGTWGSQKKMFDPALYIAPDGVWHCVWSLNDKHDTFAYVSTKDLVYWGRQSYPHLHTGKNVLAPDITFDKATQQYVISWLSEENGKTSAYRTSTTDFKKFSSPASIPVSEKPNKAQTVSINGQSKTGNIHKVAWSVLDNMIKSQQLADYKNKQMDERTIDDATRFASLKPVDATINIHCSKQKEISDLLIGIFFEDINYAADGGIYAELVQNRGFEYSPTDRGNDLSWNSLRAWKSTDNASITIDSVSPIHINNKHYAVLQNTQIGGGIANEGFDGISIQKGEKYNFSIFARVPQGTKGSLKIRLIGKNGEVYGEASTKSLSSNWKKYEGVITSKVTVADAQLEVVPQSVGTFHLDMISLFPQKTFKGRKNGLRNDLAQALADIKPRFVRFPGGCVAHGDGLGNIYHWKNTIGDLETRKPQRNLWGYHQTAGLGYFEYFQFCEDLGAEPVPIVAAGVPCQNSHTGGAGQQGGIPMEDMDAYIQDILDLIEWANGDAKTTKWGKVRAENGHPTPFNLKYIGVGNEDLITDIFEERFTMIYNAIKEKHPEIEVIGTAGPFYEGTDYVEGWDIATKLGVPIMDEHYYQSPGWFINNQDFYDRYDRSKSKVYLGEYAAHLPGRPNNLETALAEAIYLTSLERNGDIVHMTSYAPLLAKEGHTQWNPDLIYFNNSEVKLTPGYYVQKLYGENSGDKYLSSDILLSNNNDAVKKRISTSVLIDSETNDLIIKLVNILPVSVNTVLNLKDFDIANTQATKTVLTSKPDDKLAKPVESTCNVSENHSEELPPYSFTVIRIKLK